MGGGGKRPSTPPPDPYAAVAAQQAQQLWGETTPLRQQWLGYGSDILGGAPITSIPIYQGLYDKSKTGLESQFNVARGNVISQLPVGGQMYKGLTDVETERAKAIGAIPGTIMGPLTQDFLDKVYGIVAGAPQTTISGMNSAAAVEANRYASSADYGAKKGAGSMAALGGMGQGIGRILGAGTKPGAFFG